MVRRFDALGSLLRETDRRGIVSIFEYDHESRLVQSERAGLMIETMQYDGNDNRIASTDANGNLTTFEFDERNLLVRVNAPLLAISRFELDESGDRVKETDPENKVIEREYDDRRRLEAEIVAGDRTEFGYDGNGNLTSIDRPETPAWLRTYDGADRLKTVEDPNGGVTEYFYDGNGNLTSQVDAELKETLFEYNDLNRLTLKTLADGAVATYDAYDENGNLTQRTDPNGTVFALSYDELDRLVTLDLPNELDIGAMRKRQFTYDRNNNLRGVTESRIGADATTLVPVTASRTYDDFDRLSTVTDRWGTTVLYGYDDNGNRTSVTGDGLSAIYRYDALNRMETVTSGLGVTEYEYYKNSRLKSVNYPNGAVAEYTWDLSNRLDTIDNRVNLALVSRFDYAYDGNGNRILQLEERTGDPEETTTYSYDLLDRLEVVVYPDQETTYTYDGVGNRRAEQSVLTGDSGDPPAEFLVDRIYSYNDRHQVEQVENLATDGATVTYGYDPNGNQISRASTTDGVTSFTFDVFNRMTEVEKAGEILGIYLYDERDLRIEKTSPEGTARYVYDDLSVLTRTLDGSKTKYYYGPDRLLGVDDPTEGTGFYLQDALRSVVDITRSDGSLMASYKYDAWGNYREEVDSGANPFGFTGHEHDDETGLIYAKARFYDPELGLFLSEDPADDNYANPPSLHKYLYSFQNPQKYIDLDGRTEFLSNSADAMEDLQEELDYSVDEKSSTEEVIKTSVARGLVGVGETVTRAFNQVVNFFAINLAPGTIAGNEAQAEYDQIQTAIEAKADEVLTTIREDPAGFVQDLDPRRHLMQAGLDLAEEVGKAASGDKNAQGDLIAGATELAVEVAAAEFAAVGMAPRSVSRTLRTDGPDLDATVSVRETGSGAVPRGGASQELASTNAEAAVSSGPTVRYDRKKHYGGAQTNSPAGKKARAEGEGTPCPECGETQVSETPTQPVPQHNPPLVQHYYEEGGWKMTDTERRAYAKSEKAIDGAACLTCQRKEGAKMARESRKYAEKYGLEKKDDDS